MLTMPRRGNNIISAVPLSTGCISMSRGCLCCTFLSKMRIILLSGKEMACGRIREREKEYGKDQD